MLVLSTDAFKAYPLRVERAAGQCELELVAVDWLYVPDHRALRCAVQHERVARGQQLPRQFRRRAACGSRAPFKLRRVVNCQVDRGPIGRRSPTADKIGLLLGCFCRRIWLGWRLWRNRLRRRCRPPTGWFWWSWCGSNGGGLL